MPTRTTWWVSSSPASRTKPCSVLATSRAGQQPAGVVDDRDREGVLVRVDSCEHELHHLVDVSAGPATRMHSRATSTVACCPMPLSSVDADPPPPGGSHRSRASPSRRAA